MNLLISPSYAKPKPGKIKDRIIEGTIYDYTKDGKRIYRENEKKSTNKSTKSRQAYYMCS